MKTYSDLRGDGGSQIVEQLVDLKQSIKRSLAGVRTIVGIGSGKGGVGKSTLTMQLALSLAHRGFNAAILDADFNGPSIARMAGLREATMLPGVSGLILPQTIDGIGVLSVGSILSEDKSLEFDAMSHGDSHVWRSTREFTALADILMKVDWGFLDVLLVDLPPGPERTRQFAEFFGSRLNLILATIPSDVANGVVLRSIAAVKPTPSWLLGYVENMKGYICPQSGRMLKLFPGESIKLDSQVASLGEVPFEPQLAELCDRGLTLEQWLTLDVTSYIQAVTNKVLSELKVEHEVSLRKM